MATDKQDENYFEGFQTIETVTSADVRAEGGKPPSETPPANENEGEDNEDREEDPLAAFSDASESEEGDDGDDGSDDDDDGAAAEDEDEDDDEDDGESDDPDGEERRRKKPSSAKRRIRELTAARRQAERENAELRQRLEAIEKGEKPDDKQEPPASTDQGSESALVVKDNNGNVLTAPDPTDDKYKFGEVDSKYLSDLNTYNFHHGRALERDALEKERQEQAADAQRQEAQQRWDTLVDTGLDKYDDFEEKVLIGGEAKEYALTQTMFEVANSSEHGHEILYHLASNPRTADKIAAMGELEQARYLGRLEAAIETAQKGSGKEQTTRKLPGANPPPSRRTRGKGGRFVNPAQSSNFEDFEAFENERRAKQSR